MKRLGKSRWGYLPKGTKNFSSFPHHYWVGKGGACKTGMWCPRFWRIWYETSPARR